MAEVEPEAKGDLPTDFNEDDFVDHNPYPYRGGYDISLTYGQPLLPSPAICYPLHDGSTPAATTTQKTPPSKPTPVPSPSPPPPVSRPTPKEGVEKPSLPNWYGRDFHDKWSSWRNYFGRCGHGHGRWDLTQWAADFLFGYLPVYGEKRDETHSYGNLNYAYERHNWQVPFTVNVKPEGSGWLSTQQEFGNTYNGQRYDETYLYEGFTPLTDYVNAYGRYSYEKPISCYHDSWKGGDYPVNTQHQQLSYHDSWKGGYYPVNTQHQQLSYHDSWKGGDYPVNTQYQQLSYHDSWKGGDYPVMEHVNTYERESHLENAIFPVSGYHEGYDYSQVEYGNGYSEKYSDYVEEDTNWPWGLNHHEVCHEQVYPLVGHMSSCELQRYEEPISIKIEQCQSEELSSHAGDHPLLEYVSSYERQELDETITVQIEQPLSREFRYHDVYQEGIFSIAEHVNSYEKQGYGEQMSVKVETAGSNYLNYHESYWEEKKNHTETVYAFENDSRLPTCDAPHIEPFEPTWSQDLRYYDICQGNMPSQLKYDENPKEYDAWINWPFDMNSGYNE